MRSISFAQFAFLPTEIGFPITILADMVFDENWAEGPDLLCPSLSEYRFL